MKEPQSDIIQIIGQQGHNSDLIMEVKGPQSGTQSIFNNRCEGTLIRHNSDYWATVT